MEELMLSMENLKQQLICSFCNDLVCDSYKFIVCSHIFCHKHLKSNRMKKCFTCHRGDIQNVTRDQVVNQMVDEYRDLYSVFKDVKENVQQNNIPIDMLLQSEMSTQSKLNPDKNILLNENKKSKKSKSPKSGINKSSTCESVTAGSNTCENVTAESERRVLRNKQNKCNTNESLDKKIPNKTSLKTKRVGKRSNSIENYLTKPSNSRKTSTSPIKNEGNELVAQKNISNSLPLKTAEAVDKNTMNDTSKTDIRIKSNATNKKLTTSNDSISETSVISSSKDVTKRNKKGETSLHSACVFNKVELAKMLLEEGASPNSKDNAGWTPLHEAVAGGHILLVQLLLNHGAFPQVPGPHYETLLHEAVRLKLADIARLLVLAGASIHAKNDKGETPFSMAPEDIKTVLKSAEEQCIPSQHPDVSFNTQNNNVFVMFPLLLKKENSAKLQTLIKKHNNLKSVSEFSKNVTHVLVEAEDGHCHLTQETLLAVVRGKPIISSRWLAACNDASLADIGEFYITNLGGATECVHLSIMNKLTLLPGLFAGCHFYFIGFVSKYEISAHLTIKKQFLCQLVTEGGGVVLRREPNPESIPDNESVLPYHASPGSPLENCAHYIIYQNRPALAYNMKHLKSLPVAWLIECVQNFKLVDP